MAFRQHGLVAGLLCACVWWATAHAQQTSTVKNLDLAVGETVETNVEGSAPDTPIANVQGHAYYIEGESHKAQGGNTLTTNLDKAFGIYVYGKGAAADVTATDAPGIIITTHGAGSHGIYTEGGDKGATVTATDGKITTDGAGSHGIYAYGSGAAATVTTTGAIITTTKAGSYGIYTDGGRGGVTVTATGGTITTGGAGSHGIFSNASAEGGTVTLNGVAITTKGGIDGAESNGIHIMEDIEDVNVTMTGGSITVNQKGYGVYYGGAGENGLATLSGVTVITKGDGELVRPPP